MVTSNHVCTNVDGLVALVANISAFDTTVETVNKQTLDPKTTLKHMGYRWWNKECSVANTLAWSHSRPTRHEAFLALRRVTRKAKREWAHGILNDTSSPEEMWHLAGVQKGRVTRTFLPLTSPDGTLIHDPKGKLALLRERFFPPRDPDVSPIQPDDPPPLETCQWPDITPDEITDTLQHTSNRLAPGLSRVGYKTLK
jgi:hypothetical protein